MKKLQSQLVLWCVLAALGPIAGCGDDAGNGCEPGWDGCECIESETRRACDDGLRCALVDEFDDARKECWECNPGEVGCNCIDDSDDSEGGRCNDGLRCSALNECESASDSEDAGESNEADSSAASDDSADSDDSDNSDDSADSDDSDNSDDSDSSGDSDSSDDSDTGVETSSDSNDAGQDASELPTTDDDTQGTSSGEVSTTVETNATSSNLSSVGNSSNASSTQSNTSLMTSSAGTSTGDTTHEETSASTDSDASVPTTNEPPDASFTETASPDAGSNDAGSTEESCEPSGSCVDENGIDCVDGTPVARDCSPCAVVDCTDCCQAVGYFAGQITPFVTMPALIDSYVASSESATLDLTFTGNNQMGAVNVTLDEVTLVNVYNFYAQLEFSGGQEVEVSFENNDLSEPSGCLYTLGDNVSSYYFTVDLVECWGEYEDVELFDPIDVRTINVRLAATAAATASLEVGWMSWND